jgi:hypothetical protein
MSIIESLRTYLAAYTGLEDGAPLWVNHLRAMPTSYAIVQLPGARVLETEITGKTLREYPFAFQSMESTADDLERLENLGFFESFADWLEAQSEAGTLPDLGAGKAATAIVATSWGYLFEQGQSETGIYQITCRLEYEQN